jgi:hypothetical protein
MLLSLLAGVLVGGKPFDFYTEGPYDASVPKPESILRYGPGERTTTFRDQEAVLLAIANKAKDRVHVVEYGRSVEGRPLRLFVLGSPKNIAQLGTIQKEHQSLAEGKGDPSKTVPIVWINECIHGDETASFESAMWTTYTLAASRSSKITHALENAVVVLNPVYNPDGHERYTVYYDSVATGSSDPHAFEAIEPRAIYGRTNHYRFDMNRDRVAFSQDETRQEFAEMLRWNPQVYIDQHGQVSSYFFPPEPMSVNPNVDRARNAKWTDIFGRATGKAFEANGFSYFVKDTFDLYYPGYIDSSNTLSGAIGMTHETDGGRVLAHRREDGSLLTLRQGVAKHFTSAIAVVETASDHAQELLASYSDFKKKVISGAAAGKFRRVVVTAADPRPLARLQEQLKFAGISSAFATTRFTQPDATDYWTSKRTKQEFPVGSLVVDMTQPQGALAKALLEPGQGFEPEFIKAQSEKKKTAPDGETYPGPDASEFYDLTGWSLPLAHGLNASWCESAPTISVAPVAEKPATIAKSKIGYAMAYRDQGDVLAVADALCAGVRGLVSTKDMSLGGAKFGKGSFLFLADRNEDGYEEALFHCAQVHGATLVPLTTEYPDDDTRTGPGSESTLSLKPPTIGVAFGNGENLASVGGIWYLMDRVFHLPFTPLASSAFSADLSGYTTLVVPGGAGVTASSKLREWVSNGGSLVVLEGANWALGSSGFVELDSVKGEFQELPGALFKAELDPRSFLSYGYDAPSGGGKVPVVVPIGGNHFYQIKKEGGSVLTLSPDQKDSKLLSGWEWPDETEKAISGTVMVQDVSVGRGHVVIFFTDPTERAMWPGLYKLLLNAMLLGSAS